MNALKQLHRFKGYDLIMLFLNANLLYLLALDICCSTSSAREFEGARTNSVLLNGVWDFAMAAGTELPDNVSGLKSLTWRQVTLPGPFMPWNQEVANRTRHVWARRHFNVTADQASQLAVLRWNRIANGAEAFINGQNVGENEPTGPYQVIIPSGILKPGKNEIALKVRGAAGVRRSKSGNALIPAGFGVGMPEITDDVWIDFAQEVYMKWALAIPDLAGSRATIRITPIGPKSIDDLQVHAQIRRWPDGQGMGEGRTTSRLVPDPDPLGGQHFFVEVSMPGYKAWTYEEPSLYTAQVRILKDGRVLDDLAFRFGMREIKVQDRNYKLNGKNLWLRGSNLVFEWNWGDVVKGKEKDYLVTEAREMSMNSFRTHTQPPPRLWCDIGDEYGTMILAEFPVLYNYVDYKFTPEEYEIWHRNVLSDAAGWMARLWNHPSVIMWVLSNESRQDNAWEEGPFQNIVNMLDPTRPTLRTGTSGTRENLDFHPCGNVTETDEGNLQRQIQGWFKQAGPRTTTATEYMNDFGHPRTQWTGVDDRLANDIAVAQIGAEHTEAMRRARLDGIWPYMYAGWTRTRLAARVKETGKGSAIWKAGFAAPQSAAWHSSLSPVLASLDLFNASYQTGQKVTNDLYLINDSWHNASIRVDLLLTRECPEYIPEAKCFEKPITKWSYDFQLPADSIDKIPFVWNLPNEEGAYWLTARLTGVDGRAVLSQRFVRAVKPVTVSESLKQSAFILLGSDGTSDAFFRFLGLHTSSQLDSLLPEKHIVVVWNAAHLSHIEKQNARYLCDFIDRGGKVVVLSTPSWNWPELCNIKIGPAARFSRVFPYPNIQHSMLTGIDYSWLIRWNDLPGTVAVGRIEGKSLEKAQKILWARDPASTVVAEVPASTGQGRILFVQLDLQRRIDRSSSNYDPVAERILLNLLERQVKPSDK